MKFRETIQTNESLDSLQQCHLEKIKSAYQLTESEIKFLLGLRTKYQRKTLRKSLAFSIS